MEDPFSALKTALEPVFQFHEDTMRNGQYTYPAVQKLKKAIEEYEPVKPETVTNLLESLQESLPYIVRRRVDLARIKSAADNLCQMHQKTHLDWSSLPPLRGSHGFTFSALNHAPRKDDLLVLITSKSGKPYAHLDHTEITQFLVTHKEPDEFNSLLREHLKSDPEFLYKLIMNSEQNFKSIAKSRVSLYLTDKQIAEAIIKHLPSLVDKQAEPFEQVRELVQKLNDILSSGRSVTILLRNKEAKSILDKSTFFQRYQSAEYQNQAVTSKSPVQAQNPPEHDPEMDLKMDI